MKWIPLESNPQVFASYAEALGFPNDEYTFTDIYGLDPDLLAFVPAPVKAVLLLFPCGGKLSEIRKAEEKKEGTILPCEVGETETLWIPQTVGNACGTMGLLHALANAGLSIPATSPLAIFFEQCRKVSPEERTRLLSSSDLLAQAHKSASSSGQTLLREEDADTDLHFVAFVLGKGPDGRSHLIELDGGRSGPLDRGLSEDLLADTARVVKEVYMAAEPESELFSLMALAPVQKDDD